LQVRKGKLVLFKRSGQLCVGIVHDARSSKRKGVDVLTLGKNGRPGMCRIDIDGLIPSPSTKTARDLKKLIKSYWTEV